MQANDLVDRLLDRAVGMSPQQRGHLLDTIDALNGVDFAPGLNDRQRIIVDEYAHNGDHKAVAAKLGISSNVVVKEVFGVPKVAEAVREKLKERAARSELRADYVRKYIHDVLELCPTDYFTQLDNGLWCTDPETFKLAPQTVRRLVESFDLKLDKRTGDITMTVKFVSKTTMAALAARYTLTEKHDVSISAVPWEQIAKNAVPISDEDDPLEKLIQEAGEAPP